MSFNRVDPSPVKRGGMDFHGKWYLYAGGGLAIFVGYRLYASRKAASAAAATTDPNASVDTSGYTNAYDSYGTNNVQGTTPSLYGYIDPTTGAFIGAGGNTPTTVTAPSNNAQWFQQAWALLVQDGYDPVTVTTAFGKWQANASLSDDQLAICQAALALLGSPPSPLPAPHTAPPAGQGGGTTNPTPTVADGWYKDAVSGVVSQIAGGKRYRYLSTAWNRINPKPQTTTVYPTWAGYKLGLSGVYR